MKRNSDAEMGRREFLQRGAAAFGAVSMGVGGAAADGDGAPRIRRAVKLGTTDLEISDIGMGTGGLRDADLVRHAFARGITYFDTAEDYPFSSKGAAERALGEGLAGVRDQVVIASKTAAGASEKRAEFMRSLEASLGRLRTDRIDVYLNHAVNSIRRVENDEWWEFVALAKAQGKIRYTGISGHGGRLARCLGYVLDNKLVDVVLVAHNFGQDPAFHQRFTGAFDYVAVQPELPKLLERAHAAGVGTIAMKTLRGAKLNDMRPYEWGGATFAQAAFRWVLANKNVDALIVTMNSRGDIDEYVAASGQTKIRKADLRLLDHYVEKNDATYCRPGCDLCHAACPEGVEVSEVLRVRMYAADYGDVEMARGTYAQLGRGASPCLECANPACTAACPYGLDVSKLTRSVPRLLDLV